MPNESPEVVINDVLIKQVASLAIQPGASVLSISNQLGFSRYQVRKMMQTQIFKDTLKEIGDDSINQAKQIIRANIKDLADEVKRVLTESLAENSLEAVKVTLKIIGFDQQEPKQTGDTNINVMLPGSDKPVIDVKSEVD